METQNTVRRSIMDGFRDIFASVWEAEPPKTKEYIDHIECDIIGEKDGFAKDRASLSSDLTSISEDFRKSFNKLKESVHESKKVLTE